MNGNAQYSNCNFLCNIDFEDERLVGLGQFGFFHENRVSCWETTATDDLIEIWGSGFGGVQAYSGNQFAELNANQVSTLYQEFIPSVSAEVEVSFAHRGRAGLDKISVEVGPINGPYTNLGTFSADNTKWVYNTVNFQFSKTTSGKHVLRFNSVSAAGGSTVGNFLDAISIRIKAPIIGITAMKPSCTNANDGLIRIDSIKGAGPFKFRWSRDTAKRDTIDNFLSEGKYKLSITDFFGCQHEYNFDLKAESRGDSFLMNKNSCQSFFWTESGKEYFSSGKYYHPLKNRWLCDSVLILDLLIHQTDTTIIHQESCSSYLWPINNSLLDKSGTYYHSLNNVNSCDSILVLNLDILPLDTTNIPITTCDSFNWNVNNIGYSNSGKYYHKLTNIHSCDSTIQLDLTINSSYRINESISECNTFIWKVNNKKYTQNGTYFHTLKSSKGCDSIHMLNLSILPIDTIKFTKKSCVEYLWPESQTNYIESGTYLKAYKNQYQCDSVIQLDLEILNSKLTILNKESCVTYKFPYNQQNYSQSGKYVFNHLSAEGCDSVVILDLIIHPEYKKTLADEICDEYYWALNGKTYAKSGTYLHHLQSVHTCDSIIELNLQVHPSHIYTDTITTFDQFYWKATNEYYDQEGIYESKQLSSHGCDSILVLIVKKLKEGDVFIPNVFSPNDDGINDFFTVYSSPEIKVIDRLIIFDRWGNLIFEKLKFEPNIEPIGWNGDFKGQKLNPAVFAVYVEYINLKGQKKSIKGDVTLMR